MRYFSDITEKFYNSEEECLKAEKLVKEEETRLAQERENAKRQVDAAREAFDELREKLEVARDKYNMLATDFCKKYGSYTYKADKKINALTIADFLDAMLKN